ncbi:hypothetical protein BY458DRAFT_424207, partial [Sporodiniella umbellata]
FNEAYPEAYHNPFQNLRKSLFISTFKYLVPYLSIKDIVACSLINKSVHSYTCDLLWKRPSFRQPSYTHNELYIFNKFIKSLPVTRKVVLGKIEYLDLSGIQETLYERVDVGFFQAIVNYCPNIIHIDFSYGSYLTKSTLFPANLWRLSQLNTLILSHCSNVTDDMLVILARSCPRLSALALNHIPRLSGKGLAAFASECDSLDTVDVSDNRSMGDEGLVALAKFRHIHLRHLNLKGCTSVTMDGIHSIARYCVHLQSFSLADCPLEGFIPLGFKRIVLLDLSRGPRSETVLSWLSNASLDSLVSLSVDFEAL